MSTAIVDDGNVKHQASHQNITNTMNKNVTELNKTLLNEETENKLKIFQINAESMQTSIVSTISYHIYTLSASLST